MAIYTVQDTTMTALGDAIRKQTGKYITTDIKNAEPDFILTGNTAEFTDEPWMTYQGEEMYMFQIDLKALLGDKFDLTKKYYVEYNVSSNNGNPVNIDILFAYQGLTTGGKQRIVGVNSIISLTDSVIIPNTTTYNTYGLYLEVDRLITNENFDYSYELKFWSCDNNNLFFTLNTYTPAEMVNEINSFNIFPEDKFLLTGDCQYRFSDDYGWDWALEKYIDKWQTNNLTNISYMFQRNTIEKIPFEINGRSGSTVNAMNLFYYCQNLKEIPVLNIPKIHIQGYMFFQCDNLKEITDEQWNVTEYDRNGYGGGYRISSCYSLRRITTKLLNNLWDTYPSNYSSCYLELFNNCWTLDEVKGLGVSTATYTSNMFGGMAGNCARLKDFTFAVNEDGTPKTANWSNQVIDLSNYIGYLYSASYEGRILNYNSGITADKKVYDDATYQALKNDPDWYSLDINYSRYNHDSAVNTINSLPDCSGSGGTNTIKFKGAAGALTDGGAINTLTEEEIAVASAKGWTVSLV